MSTRAAPAGLTARIRRETTHDGAKTPAIPTDLFFHAHYRRNAVLPSTRAELP